MNTCTVSATVEEMSVDEGRAMFDGLAKDRLGLGRAEFLQRLDVGEYDGSEDEDVIRLSVLAPFGR